MEQDPDHGATILMRPPEILDYSLTGHNAERAVELGLAEADWYQSPLPRATMRKFLERRDGPAIRDTLLLVRDTRRHWLCHRRSVGQLVGRDPLSDLCGVLRHQLGLALARV